MPITAVFILPSSPSQHKRVVRMNRYLSPYLLCVAFLLLGACESYDFSVNENVVYSPAPLFSDFEAADSTLQQCLVEAVAGGKITQANQLKTLNCSHAGVTDLAGIETFTGISRLKLSSNSIRNIRPLATLTVLEILLLDDNTLIDTIPLIELPALRELDLSGNPELLCPASSSLVALESLTLPAHCQ